MAAAELAFVAGFIAGSLKRLLILHLMLGKLWSLLRAIFGHDGSIAGCAEYLNIPSTYDGRLNTIGIRSLSIEFEATPPGREHSYLL